MNDLEKQIWITAYVAEFNRMTTNLGSSGVRFDNEREHVNDAVVLASERATLVVLSLRAEVLDARVLKECCSETYDMFCEVTHRV